MRVLFLARKALLASPSVEKVKTRTVAGDTQPQGDFPVLPLKQNGPRAWNIS